MAQMVRNQPAMQETLGLIPGSGKSPGEENGNPLLYSCLEHSTDRGARWATVYGVTKSWIQLTDQHFHILERARSNEGLRGPKHMLAAYGMPPGGLRMGWISLKTSVL